VARLTGRSYEQLRVTLLEFLDTDVFNLSPENCIFLPGSTDESWDVDLTTLVWRLVLNRRIPQGILRDMSLLNGGPDQPEVEAGVQRIPE